MCVRGLLVAWGLSCLLSPALAAGAPDTSRHGRLLEAAADFRERAVNDHAAALEHHAAPGAQQGFARLDQVMWPATPPRLGWSFFMSTAIVTVGALESPRPVVAFYHPWSDVFLLTEWELDGERPRLAEAEPLMGDWLRRDGIPPFSPVPAWLRSPQFKPAALARTAAEAVMAFEATVPLAGERGWRSYLPRGEDEPLQEHNRAGVSLSLAASLHGLGMCHSSRDQEDPRLAAVRSFVADATDRAGRADVAPLLGGRETLAEMERSLRELPATLLASLQPVSVILGKGDVLVFLACLEQSDLVLSLVLDTQTGGAPVLRRVDVISYAQTYHHLHAETD